MFEITQLAVNETFDLALKGPMGEALVDADGRALSVTIYGPGSKAYQRAQAGRNQRLIERLAAGGKTRLSAEDNQRETAAFLSACTVAFNGWLYKGASDAGAIEAAYLDPSIGFIADQVSAAIGDWSNFTNSSARS